MNMKKKILLKSRILKNKIFLAPRKVVSRIPLGFSNFPLEKNVKILFAILTIGLFLVAGCSQQVITGDVSHDDVQATGELKEFDIIAKNWEFVPDTIEVTLGDKVELHLESVDVTHGFMLPEFGVNEILEPHDDVHIEFIADKKGTFPFYCSVPCGSGHSRMSGQLIVK